MNKTVRDNEFYSTLLLPMFGAPGTMNLIFKKSAFSLSKSLNLIIINNVIDDIPGNVKRSIVEEVLDLIISLFI